MEIKQSKSAQRLPWIYIIVLYIVAIVAATFPYIADVVAPKAEHQLPIYVLICVILCTITTILGIANCVMAVKNCKSDREDYLRRCLVIVKYATIPYYLGCAALILCGFLTVMFGGVILMMLGAIFQGGVFVVSIFYAWSYLIVTVKNGSRKISMAIVHGILLAIYVVDVVDTIVIMLREKKYVIPSFIVIIATIVGLVWFGISSILL